MASFIMKKSEQRRGDGKESAKRQKIFFLIFDLSTWGKWRHKKNRFFVKMLSPLVSLSPNNVLFTNNLWTRLNSMFENSKMKNLNLSLTMKFPTSLLRNVNDIPCKFYYIFIVFFFLC